MIISKYYKKFGDMLKIDLFAFKYTAVHVGFNGSMSFPLSVNIIRVVLLRKVLRITNRIG